jgi:hypothetical protein
MPRWRYRVQKAPIAKSLDDYSGFDSALYRNDETKWHFSRENATSHAVKMAALESKPL